MKCKIKIYVEEKVPIEQALKQITDKWLDGGKYCDQTLFDMRDALKQLFSENKALREFVEEISTNTCVNSEHISCVNDDTWNCDDCKQRKAKALLAKLDKGEN